MKGSQWGGILILIIAAIVTTATLLGGPTGRQSYIESQKQDIIQVSDNQFCLNFARSISGTVEHKNNIYQNCSKGD